MLESPLVQVGIGLGVFVYLLTQGARGAQSVSLWYRRRNGGGNPGNPGHGLEETLRRHDDEREMREAMRLIVEQIKALVDTTGDQQKQIQALVAANELLCMRLKERPCLRETEKV